VILTDSEGLFSLKDLSDDHSLLSPVEVLGEDTLKDVDSADESILSEQCENELERRIDDVLKRNGLCRVPIDRGCVTHYLAWG
jgi:hypothetical protein